MTTDFEIPAATFAYLDRAASSLREAFSPARIDQDFLRDILGVSAEAMQEPAFDLLATLGPVDLLPDLAGVDQVRLGGEVGVVAGLGAEGHAALATVERDQHRQPLRLLLERVVLDGSGMDRILGIDTFNMQASVQCGVCLQTLEDAVRKMSSAVATRLSIADRGFVHGFLDVAWSLAIEEHFYLAWPVVMLLLPARVLPWVAGLGRTSGSGAGGGLGLGRGGLRLGHAHLLLILFEEHGAAGATHLLLALDAGGRLIGHNRGAQLLLQGLPAVYRHARRPDGCQQQDLRAHHQCAAGQQQHARAAAGEHAGGEHDVVPHLVAQRPVRRVRERHDGNRPDLVQPCQAGCNA